MPITNEEKEERIAVYKELSKQLYLASNSSSIDAATIQAAAASKKLDELKESVKKDLENVKKIKNERIESLKTGELALNDLPDYPFNNHGEKQSYRERIQIGTGLHQLPRYEYKLKNPEGKSYSSGKDDGELYKFCLLRFVEPREHLISKDYYLDPRILLVQKRIDYFFTHPQPILSSASKSSTLKIYNFVAEALTSNDRNQNNKAIAQIKTNDNILYKVNLAEIIALTIAERKVLLDLIKSGTSLFKIEVEVTSKDILIRIKNAIGSKDMAKQFEGQTADLLHKNGIYIKNFNQVFNNYQIDVEVKKIVIECKTNLNNRSASSIIEQVIRLSNNTGKKVIIYSGTPVDYSVKSVNDIVNGLKGQNLKYEIIDNAQDLLKIVK